MKTEFWLCLNTARKSKHYYKCYFLNKVKHLLSNIVITWLWLWICSAVALGGDYLKGVLAAVT